MLTVAEISERLMADRELLLNAIDDPKRTMAIRLALLQSIHDRDWLISRIPPKLKEIRKDHVETNT
jgi:hypothetical protein